MTAWPTPATPGRGGGWRRIVRVVRREDRRDFYLHDLPQGGDRPRELVPEKEKPTRYDAAEAHRLARELRAEGHWVVVVRLRPKAERRRPTGIVRVASDVYGDVEPSSLPAIPAGTYGVVVGHTEYGALVSLGAPWGTQHLGHHNLVDAPACLGNAYDLIKGRHRPMAVVLRRARASFAGPYLALAVKEEGIDGRFAIEAYAHTHGRRGVLKLLKRAIELAKTAAGWRAPKSVDSGEGTST